MVSNLYDVKSFYEKQKKGEVARNMSKSKQLQKDNKGFYLTKSKSNGLTYKDRLNNSDLLYARSSTQGVTKYNSELDRTKKTQRLEESKKDHQKHLHTGDRARGKGVYNI